MLILVVFMTLLKTKSANSAYSISFSFTGSVQTWLCPAGMLSIQVDAYGAQGGVGNGCGSNCGTAGLGGYISVSNVPVTSGNTYYIYVGGKGAYGNLLVGSIYGGGYNGGGPIATDGTANNYASNSGTIGIGGGATDIRTASSDLKSRYY